MHSAQTMEPNLPLARALGGRGLIDGVFSWQYLCDGIHADAKCEVLGEDDDGGNGWIVWRRNSTTGIAVLRDDGQSVRCFYIDAESPFMDLFEAQRWLQSLTQAELVCATAALQVAASG